MDILEFRIEFGDYRPSADGDIQQSIVRRQGLGEHGGFLSVAKKDPRGQKRPTVDRGGEN